jgi:hypothetical protein
MGTVKDAGRFGVLNYIKNGFYRLIRRTHIQQRLIILFLALSVVPLTITGFLAYNKSSSAIESKIKVYSVQVLNELSKNIAFKMDKVEYATDQIYLSQTIQDNMPLFITNNYDYSISSVNEVKRIIKEKFAIISEVSIGEIVSNTNIVFSGIVQQQGNNAGFPIAVMDNFDSFKETALKYNGGKVWVFPKDPKLYNNIFIFVPCVHWLTTGHWVH